jgi:rhodanese-related sulfurtransferase
LNRLRSFFFIFGLMVIASLLIACGASEEPAAPTAAATSTPEPTAESTLPAESQGPTELSEVPRITVVELKERLDNGEEIVVVDTRGKSSYDVRHLPGAILAPDSFDEYPLDQQIVLYCAWPAESTSAGSALKLYGNGYTNVSALLGGVSAWVEAGYPTEES